MRQLVLVLGAIVALVAIGLAFRVLTTRPGRVNCGTVTGADGKTYSITGPAGSDCTVSPGIFTAPDGRRFTIRAR